MMWFAIIRGFFSKLGLTNSIAIVVGLVLLGYIGVLKLEIRGLNEDVKDITEEKNKIQGKYEMVKVVLDDINEKIVKLGEEKGKLDERLNAANVKNLELDRKNKKLLDDLNNKPIPKDCKDSITELKSVFSSMSNSWNSK